MIINVKPDEFADLVMAYLLEMMRHDELMPDNDRFKDFIDKMNGKGMKQEAYRNYIEMNADTRIKFRRVKDYLFEEGHGTARIEIGSGVTPYVNEEFDRELCKKIFRTIKEVRFKRPEKVLTEERIDKIIDYCIEQKEKDNG